jgi:hypothetical protein
LYRQSEQQNKSLKWKMNQRIQLINSGMRAVPFFFKNRSIVAQNQKTKIHSLFLFISLEDFGKTVHQHSWLVL